MKLRLQRGVTLIEILMAGLLLSVVFLATTSAYIAALKFFGSVRDKSGQIYGFMGVEHIARRVELANEIIVNNGGVVNINAGKQIKMRWDYDALGTPLNTPSNVADDTWVKHRFIENPGGSGVWKLYWRTDTAAAGPVADVTTADPQIEPQLTTNTNSTFTLTSPSGLAEGQRTVLTIVLEAVIGPRTIPIRTDVNVGSKAKR